MAVHGLVQSGKPAAPLFAGLFAVVVSFCSPPPHLLRR